VNNRVLSHSDSSHFQVRLISICSLSYTLNIHMSNSTMKWWNQAVTCCTSIKVPNMLLLLIKVKSYYTLLLTLPVNGYLCCFSFFNSFCSVRVSTTPGLDHINFVWNKMTASEFEKHWQEKNSGEKMDFIHMIQVLTFSLILSTLIKVILIRSVYQRCFVMFVEY